MLSNEILRQRLLDDFDCKLAQVDDLVDRIGRMAPDLREALDGYMQTGSVREVEVEGYTVAALRRKKPQMNVIGAYLTLDWLRREPRLAALALEQNELANSAVLRGVMPRRE